MFSEEKLFTKIPFPFSIDINPFALSVLSASRIAVRLTSNWLHNCISVGNRSPEASFFVKIASSISEAIFLLNDSLFPINLKILIDLRHHMYYMLPNLINLFSFVKLNFSKIIFFFQEDMNTKAQ